MSWTFWLILIPTLCYSGAAVAYGLKGNWPLAITYGGYFIGNIGLLALDVKLR